MGRLETIRDWATGYPGYEGLMKLNALVMRDGDGGVMSEGVETVTEEYIDGAEVREAEISLYVSTPWSEGDDDLNSEAADLMEGWADWISSEWRENPPVLDGAEVTAVTPLCTFPQIQYVNETGRVAVYKLTLEITIQLG